MHVPGHPGPLGFDSFVLFQRADLFLVLNALTDILMRAAHAQRPLILITSNNPGAIEDPLILAILCPHSISHLMHRRLARQMVLYGCPCPRAVLWMDEFRPMYRLAFDLCQHVTKHLVPTLVLPRF